MLTRVGTTARRKPMDRADRPSAVTMADVAERAGVSRALVSIVFRGVPGASPATRERVMVAAHQLGYRPDARARLLGSKRSRLVGVVFGLQQEFHAELVDELYRAAEPTAYDLGLGAVSGSRSERRAVQSLLDYRCEALVLLGPSTATRDLELLATRVPVVVVARHTRSAALDTVRTDDRLGARLAVEHLAGLGHEEITLLDGGRTPGAAERRRGYRDAMHASGLADRIRSVPGGPSEEQGERATAAALEDRGTTALVAFNDSCAAGVVAAARARGIAVPEQLSVTGYDDSRIAALSTLRLTTVAQDAATMARTALQLALERTDSGRSSRTEVVVPPRLVVRDTTRRPPS
jgi:DNA-binding LacI/PurR family transcriptional regulator